MTDYKKYINALRKCAKEHENDRTSTGHIIVSDLCKDIAKLLEEQEPCEDAISRQAVIYYVKAHIHEIITESGIDKNEHTNRVLRAIMNGVETMPSVNPQTRWIPVSERLPEDNENVLMTICRMDGRHNDYPFVSVGYIGWNQQSWWCAHDGDCAENHVEVLAWMPLPEPYKVESEET